MEIRHIERVLKIRKLIKKHNIKLSEAYTDLELSYAFWDIDKEVMLYNLEAEADS